MMKWIFFAFWVMLFITSCEKEVHLNLDDDSGSLVIEGNVTDQEGPYYVRITKSISVADSNIYPAVTNALVVLKDNDGLVDTLSYEADGRYTTSGFVGSPGRIYSLIVVVEGVEYTAQSKMPQPVILDSLTQDSSHINGDIAYYILPIYTDPVELGNRYLFSYSINSRSKIIYQTFSDNIDNGLVNQRSIILPWNDDDDNNKKVVAGDTVHIEMQCVDEAIYTYYTALVQISDNSRPGGGVTPSNPPSNLSNGALGYFSAHTAKALSTTLK